MYLFTAAQQCKALGMTVWGFSRRKKQDKDKSSTFDVHKYTFFFQNIYNYVASIERQVLTTYTNLSRFSFWELYQYSRANM